MNKKLLLTSFLLIAGLILSACSGSPNTSSSGDSGSPASSNTSVSETETPETPTQPSGGGLLNVAGSTSVGPLMEELVIAYRESGSSTSIEVQQTGSSAGITAAIDGAAEIGMSSRDLKDEELANGLVDITIAIDGIAVIVHPDNPVQDLTSAQIASIYSGEITNWSDLGGSDETIIVVSREEGSGTRGAFEELLDLEDISSSALFENSTGSVKTTVSTTQTAIGYISLGSLDSDVSAVNVDGAPCTVADVKSGSYPIARPFILCTMGEPAGDAKTFIDFILSDAGQAVVVDNNYISVD